MVHIFFLFATVKPPVNSWGWFTFFKNNVQHIALIGDKQLPESFGVCVRVSVWRRNQLLPLNPPVPPHSAFDTLFGCMPKYQSAGSLESMLMVLVFRTDWTFDDVGTYTFHSKNASLWADKQVPMWHALRHSSTYMLSHWRAQFLECKHTTSRWGLHALAERHVCVLEQESLIYLCHHEYVIKLLLREDIAPQQGVHKAGTRVPYCFHWNLIAGHCRVQREGEGPE